MNNPHETLELKSLREHMLQASPRSFRQPDDVRRAIREIEWHTKVASLRRRVALATCTAVVVSVLSIGGGAWLLSRPRIHDIQGTHRIAAVTQPSQQPANTITIHNTSSSAMIFDAGLAVGRILVRPGTRASYDPQHRIFHLSTGEVVAHIIPSGRGFRITTAQDAFVVHGTLFSVNAETQALHVWEGTVERQHKNGALLAMIAGTRHYDGFSPQELTWLGVTVTTVATASRTRHFHLSPRPPASPTITDKPNMTPAAVASEVNPEHQLLLIAQQQIRAEQSDLALATLKSHRQQFPQSQFQQETDLLRLQALIQLKRYASVVTQAAQFLQTYPNSAKRSEILTLMQHAQSFLQSQ